MIHTSNVGELPGFFTLLVRTYEPFNSWKGVHLTDDINSSRGYMQILPKCTLGNNFRGKHPLGLPPLGEGSYTLVKGGSLFCGVKNVFFF